MPSLALYYTLQLTGTNGLVCIMALGEVLAVLELPAMMHSGEKQAHLDSTGRAWYLFHEIAALRGGKNQEEE